MTQQLLLHSPVTLKLQEEEEEQLLAQYYIACAPDAKFLILYAHDVASVLISVSFCAAKTCRVKALS